MDFIRKNWSRLSLAFLYLIGGVIAVIAWVNNKAMLSVGGWMERMYFITACVSTIAFFFGMAAIAVVKSLQNSKKAVSVIYMVLGGLVTLMLLTVIVVATCKNVEKIAFTDFFALYLVWIPLFVFGLHPLIKGVTRFIEATNVPAKAPAAPVAQPVAETPAEAPKATAKKTSAKAAK